MAQNLVSFDIEFDEDLRPLCIAAYDGAVTYLWTPESEVMTENQIRGFIDWLLSQTGSVVTWNGTQCDFKILRQYASPDAAKAMKALVLRHTDIALIAAATMRTMMPLRKVDVGIVIESLGEHVPALWRSGDRDTVVRHLQSDVIKTHQIMTHLMTSKVLPWTTAKGSPKTWIFDEGLGLSDGAVWTVNDCYVNTVPSEDDTPRWFRCAEIVEQWL